MNMKHLPISINHNHGNLTLRDHSRVHIPAAIGAAVWSMGAPQKEVEEFGAHVVRAVNAHPELVEFVRQVSRADRHALGAAADTLLAKVAPSDAAQLTAAFTARDTRRLIGAEMRVKESADMPRHLHGMRVKVLRQSQRTSGLTVEALETRVPYKVGDEIHVAQYDLEPMT